MPGLLEKNKMEKKVCLLLPDYAADALNSRVPWEAPVKLQFCNQ